MKIKNIARELAVLSTMGVAALREQYLDAFGQQTTSRNAAFLRKKIGYRIQELAEGGLSERARRRIIELAGESPLRQRGRLPELAPPPEVPAAPARARDERLPAPGTVLRKTYKAKLHEVVVREGDFVYDGRPYTTLSAVANAITGAHWNGWRFFGLKGEAAA